LAGDLIDSLEFANQQLEAHPLTWGDPLFHDETLDLLFFRRLAKMPGHPLGES